MTPTLQPPRILVVEDNALTALEMAYELIELGCQVIGPMGNLVDGVTAAREAHVDFALLDYDLGNGTNSSPIAAVLAARGVPFAFVSGSDTHTIHEAMPKATILGKPLQGGALTELIHSIRNVGFPAFAS